MTTGPDHGDKPRASPLSKAMPKRCPIVTILSCLNKTTYGIRNPGGFIAILSRWQKSDRRAMPGGQNGS
jgi:hypothetical protein